MPRTTVLSIAALATLLSSPAYGHKLRGYLSQGGLDFISAQVPSLVPKELYPADLSKDLACVTATQRKTHVTLAVNDFSISIPRAGRLRLYVDLSASGSGELFIDDLYACAGSMKCQDSFSVQNARAAIEFDVMLTGGAPAVDLAQVDLQLAQEDIQIQVSGCIAGNVATWVVGFAKKYLTDFLLAKAEEMAAQKLGPMVEEMLGGVGAFSGRFQSTGYQAALSDLLVESGGIDLGADVSLSGLSDAAACVREFDRGAPVDLSGPLPDLGAVPSQLGLAVNFGLLNNAIYQLWRGGLTCMTGDALDQLGVHLDRDHLLQLLPGFPPGSTLDMEMRMTAPPEVGGASADGLGVVLTIKGLEVRLLGHLPDGSLRKIDLAADARVTAQVGIDVGSNALVAAPMAMEILRLEMDHVYAAETGFDVTRLRDMMQTQVLPKLLGKMGAIPLTGPVFAAAGYAVILRGLDNNDAYLSLNADLFKVPDNDLGAPETSILDYPSGTVSPEKSILRVGGVDGMIPTELLQYEVTVNGEVRPPSFIRRFTVGQPGESGSYQVEVAAIDLSGNADQSPASVIVSVDGIAPQVVVDGDRVRKMEAGAAQIAWTMSDDLTNAALLGARVELYRLTDPTDALSVEHVRTIELAAGATSASVDVEDGNIYRAEVQVTDAVGNRTVATVLLDSQSGGCRVAGGGASPLLVLLGIALLARRRRYGRASTTGAP